MVSEFFQEQHLIIGRHNHQMSELTAEAMAWLAQGDLKFSEFQIEQEANFEKQKRKLAQAKEELRDTQNECEYLVSEMAARAQEPKPITGPDALHIALAKK